MPLVNQQATLPPQRWHIAAAKTEQVAQVAQYTGLFPLLAQVLVNQGIVTPGMAQAYLEPESLTLPDPLEEFPDLLLSLELLEGAISTQQKIVICGDYDADGMTSTALLLRAFAALGGQADYAIPSRMSEGYGINERIVEDCAAEGVKLILTVDNGIAAPQPVKRARELGLDVIITDHHELPPELPPANAILNPKLIRADSPYQGLAGVGVAYILAVSLAQKLEQSQSLIKPLLELFTLGTIADLAPLTGVNRRWLKRGLQLLPHSKLAGVQALIEVAGCNDPSQKKTLKPEAIGFRLGPRINAVGRIADPQTVIELLTTDDRATALDRAMQCEQANRERQRLCTEIEQAAIECVEGLQSRDSPQQQRVLVLVEPDWHHGVIGIVASRLVERYGVPVFIGTYENEARTQIRGSARGIPEFDVFAALQYCEDLLGRFGGHRAAGGFSMQADQLEFLRSRLSQFAHEELQPHHLKPLVEIDGPANFAQINWDLFDQIDRLQPCGIGNREPTFWTPQVQVLDQRQVGADKLHLKLTLAQVDPTHPQERVVKQVMAWRWGPSYPLPDWIDVAYRLRENNWRGEKTLELELLGARPATKPLPERLDEEQVLLPPVTATPSAAASEEDESVAQPLQEPVLVCPEPLLQLPLPVWKPLETLESLQVEGNLLVYGDQRPYISRQQIKGAIEYDRPTQPCQTLLLWTLPPSATHLRWLLGLGRPQTVYVHEKIPQQLEVTVLRSHLKFELIKSIGGELNLLELGQKWWVSPRLIVALIRELGYTCPSFSETSSLEQELKALEGWYRLRADQLAEQI
ncbi:MAG: single-stranded-DNA-specific exonuclease RecJ [Thermosynechococcaceae cyanobacterium]